MDIGQMMAAMQQMPNNIMSGKGCDAGVSADSSGIDFSGLLKEIRAQIKVADVNAEQLSTKSAPAEQPGSEISDGTLNALMGTLAGAVLQPPVQNSTVPKSLDSAKSEVAKDEHSVSPNVLTNQPEIPLDLLMAQLQVKMPVSVNQLEGKTESVQTTQVAVSGSGGLENFRTEIMSAKAGEVSNAEENGMKLVNVSEKRDELLGFAAQAADVRSNADAEKAGKVSMHPVNDQNGMLTSTSTLELPVDEQKVAARDSLQKAQSVVGEIPATTPQNEVKVTEGDNKPAVIEKGGQRSAERIFFGSDQKVVQATKDAPLQASEQVDVLLQQYVSRTVKPVVGEVDSTMKAVQQAGVKVSFPVGTENRVLQLDQPHTSIPTTEAAVQAVIRPMQMQIVNADLSASQEQSLEPPVQQETNPMARSVVPTTQPVADVSLRSPEIASESRTVRIEPGNGMKMQQSDSMESVKNGAVANSQEKNSGTLNQESTDQGMNGNFQSHMMGHQVKSEAVPTAGTVSAAMPGDVSRPAQSPEQVVQQVRDRFAAHDTKQGSDQIVLRLTPEHLGELKVNLNLEGQRLKVEIVAENRMVRDSLMQHTDSLKESLSRQNIKMESFDVSTGGNSQPDGGRSQNEWRELANQRQQKAWIPEGGYRLTKPVVPTVAAYQPKSQHTMVDLHY